MAYILAVVDEFPDIRSLRITPDEVDESTTRPTRRRASVGERRICLLCVDEGGADGLK